MFLSAHARWARTANYGALPIRPLSGAPPCGESINKPWTND